jgi:hypothetical protein
VVLRMPPREEPPPMPIPVAVAPEPPVPAPAPVAAVKPTEPEAPAAPTLVHFQVTSAAKKARVAFRGRVYMLPLLLEVKPGGAPESVEVTAPGHIGRRFWITFDTEKMSLNAPLNRGNGVTEASETETAVALGNAPPEALDQEPVHRTATRKEKEDKALAAAMAAAQAAAQNPTPIPQPPVEVAPPPPVEAAPPPPVQKAAEPAPKPALDPGESETADVAVINPFEAGDMRNAINSQMNTLKTCTAAAHQDNPDFTGNVTLTIEIEGDGVVASASANAGPGNSKFATCVIKTVRKWKFPRPPGEKRTRMIFPLFLG